MRRGLEAAPPVTIVCTEAFWYFLEADSLLHSKPGPVAEADSREGGGVWRFIDPTHPSCR